MFLMEISNTKYFKVDASIHDEHLAEECAWNTVVLILKGNRDIQGIGLFKVLCNTLTGILNFHLAAAIQFHDTLHGFCMGRGARTTSLEDNLLQQFMATREEVLYEGFKDLHKTYDALDCDHSLEILSVHGMGPRAICLLVRYWN